MRYLYIIRATGFPPIGCRGHYVARLLGLCFETSQVEFNNGQWEGDGP